MYVGHGLLAFTLGGVVARRFGCDRRDALVVALLSAFFGMIPDIDGIYTLYVTILAQPESLFPVTESVWAQPNSWAVHRTLTHSVVVAGLAVAYVRAIGGVSRSRRTPRAVLPVLTLALTLGVIGYGSDGQLGLGLMGLYMLAITAAGVWGVRNGVPARFIAVAAGIGLVSHPLGDVFMGRPPLILYPVSDVQLMEQVELAADPTVNLVALFALEVLLGWLALATTKSLVQEPIFSRLASRSLAGFSVSPTAFYIVPPTLQSAYHFAILVIGIGIIVGLLPGIVFRSERENGERFEGPTTALATVTFSITGYLFVYSLLPLSL